MLQIAYRQLSQHHLKLSPAQMQYQLQHLLMILLVITSTHNCLLLLNTFRLLDRSTSHCLLFLKYLLNQETSCVLVWNFIALILFRSILKNYIVTTFILMLLLKMLFLIMEIYQPCKKNRNTTPVPRPSLFGQVMHMDIVFGPEVAISNIHYALLFTDRFSRMTYIYPL